MKDYLMKFRSEVFSGAVSLFKRVFFPSILLNIILAILVMITLAIIFSAFGLSMMEMGSFNERMRSSQMNQDYSWLFNGFAIGIFFVFMLVFLIIGAWIYNSYLQLNDNEVREKNNNVLFALSRSFSSRVFSIIAWMLLMLLLTIAVFAIYAMLMSLLMKIPVIGVIVAFIGYFVIVIFLLRFILALPAIAHGKMTVSEAMKFSYTNITWKRAGLIFLTMLVFYVIVFIVMMITTFILGISMFSPNIDPSNTPGFGSALGFVLFMVIFYAAMLAFGFSCLSALYFRYSVDGLEETDYKDHLVE